MVVTVVQINIKMVVRVVQVVEVVIMGVQVVVMLLDRDMLDGLL